jgi:isochorismate synthase
MEQQSFHLSKTLIQSVAHLLKEQFAFVLFNAPFSSNFHLIIDQKEVNGEQFCLHSFDDLVHIEIKGEMLTNEAIDRVLQLKNSKPLKVVQLASADYLSQNEYEDYVMKIIQSIQQGKLSKCVAARKKKVALNLSFNVGEAFVELSSKYENAFCYLANSKAGLWMGATPELLLHKKENRYFTVALAGTKLAKEQRDWTVKEREEHQIVVDYIKQTIQNNGFQVAETSPVFDGVYGHLLHLKMELNFYASRSLHQELHPTPAVCGIPVDKAKDIILQNEGPSRSLYAGYLGLEGEHASYYVNLRCMQLFKDHADLYIGAGITAESDPEKEWLETEAKSKVMGELLQNL